MIAKGFVVVTHKYVAATPDDLVRYLAARFEKVLYIWHDFADNPNRRSFSQELQCGSVVKSSVSDDYRSAPEAIVLLKDWIFTILTILRTKERWDVLIGVSGFDALPGIVLTKLGRVGRTVFWAGDFVPQSRFEATWKNVLYLQVNRLVLKWCDFAWNISPRVERTREAMYRVKSRRPQRVVPIGVWINRRLRLPIGKILRHRLLFVGHLLEKQGVQLVLQALPEIRKTIADFEFLIVGKGSYESELREMVRKLEIEDSVIFAGYMKSDKEMEQVSSRCACAVAPYDRNTDTWTLYADPAKIKNYLASGLPVILTDVPHNAYEIQRRRCGIVIDYNVHELAAAVVTMLSNESLLEEYRRNAYEYAKQFDWNNIFDGAINEVLTSGSDRSHGA